ncbi:hypothetical protein TNCV_704981 [Trichonephila clavipes]|nr:hypothetical protein TNCV_704981 [Trichonephila clavipes]
MSVWSGWVHIRTVGPLAYGLKLVSAVMDITTRSRCTRWRTPVHSWHLGRIAKAYTPEELGLFGYTA